MGILLLLFAAAYSDGSGPRLVPPSGTEVVSRAFSFLGRPYGAAQRRGPDLDCSGFVKEVYGQLGVRLPPVSREQVRRGAAVEFDSLIPGDLVFFWSRRSGPGRVGHVGIVASVDGMGRTWMIHSSTRGIRLDTVGRSKHGRYICARRILEWAPLDTAAPPLDLEAAVTEK